MKRKIMIVAVSVILFLFSAGVCFPSFLTREYPLSPNAPGIADKVLVIKSKRELRLLRNGIIMKTFRVALGANPVGHKYREGDGRTPEGRYVLDWRNPDSGYYKSIHISYPDTLDRRYSEQLGVSPGGDIMIHGLPDNMAWMGRFHRLMDWTDGCIAVTNAEMDEIWHRVRDGTPIEILG